MSLVACPRIDDAAGYVLRAMPDADADSYGRHITECETCAAKVADLRFVSHALLNAVPQVTAPPEIRDRVMSIVRAEAELLQAAGASADRPPKPGRRRLDRGFGRLRPLTIGVLAAVLVVLGLGVGVLLNGQGEQCTTTPATVAGAAGPAASGALEVCGGDATLALVGMKPPPAGRIYEVWLDDPDDRRGPQPGALFSVRAGRASVDVGALHGRTVLVTHEPSPNGSEVPTRTPVVKASA